MKWSNLAVSYVLTPAPAKEMQRKGSSSIHIQQYLLQTHISDRSVIFQHGPYASLSNLYLMKLFGFLCCACPEASSRPSSTSKARNIYICDLESQYSSLQVEEMYLRRRYLERRKTVSFAEDFCVKKVQLNPRKAVTSILKSPGQSPRHSQ